jgi:hypothetical protein
MKSKKFSMKDLGVEALVGRHVVSAKINEGKDAVILETKTGNLYLSWVGDCCASCFIEHFNGVEFLIDATILSAENTEWSYLKRNEDDYDVIETMGTKIKTNKGYVDIETRVSHNGYYGGMINVSDDDFIDQYSSPRFEDDRPEFRELREF